MSKSTQESPVDEVKALRLLYQIRYMLARPLQTKLLPFFVPVIPLPYLKHVPYITVGQLLLMFPWLLIFLAGYHSTFNSPDLTSGGTIASFAIVAAFLTANKASSVFTFFFGLSFERMVPIHNLYACLAVILSVFHGYVAYVHGDDDDSGDGGGSRDRRLSSDESQYALFGPDADLWKFLWDGDVNMTGSVCTACLVGLVLTSFFRIIRKYLFEPWLISHIVFSFGVIIFGVLHSVPLLILPFVWWMLDLVLRYGLHSCRRFPTNATLTKLSDDLVEVRFRRTFAFEAGQFVQINIPAVGATQFHPVTLSSAPFQKEAVLHIRALGGWSKALVKLAENTPEVNMLVEGPYGNLSVDVKDDQLYPVVLCISGGIGVTPCESVARQLIHDADHGSKLSHLRFVWVVRHTTMLESLPTVATDGSMMADEEADKDGEIASSSISARQLLPEVYLTKATETDVANRSHLRLGRPDIQAIIKETVAVAKAKGVGRVAVITCGPERMVETVKDACRGMSGLCGGVTFDLHDEIFDF